MFLRKDIQQFAKKVWLASPTMNSVVAEKKSILFLYSIHTI